MKNLCYSMAVLATATLPLAAQGPLTPSGPPSPEMRTLDQLESRTPIESLPFSINEPGSYYLTSNLHRDGGPAILINVDDVTVDLMGFTLSGTASNGIQVNPPIGESIKHLVVRNGTITGFSAGLRLVRSVGGVFEDLAIRDSGMNGVSVSGGAGNTFRRCTVAGSQSQGFRFFAAADAASVDHVIEDCVIVDNGSDGVRFAPDSLGVVSGVAIRGSTIVGNTASGGGGGIFIWAPSDAETDGIRIFNNAISDNAPRGLELRAAEGTIRYTSIEGNTLQGHDNVGILLTSHTSPNGVVLGTQVEGNVISRNRFLGGIYLNHTNLMSSRLVVKENVLADNGYSSAVGHMTFAQTTGTIIQGNHLSGEATHGLKTENSSNQLVVQNSVFGEPFVVSANDQYGPISGSGPTPNNAWANFLLD